MSIPPEDVRRLLTQAGRPVGVKELLRVGGFSPGQQTELKRVLRDLLRTGEIRKDGKRFLVPTATQEGEPLTKRRAGPWAEAPVVVKAQGESSAPARWPATDRQGRGHREREERPGQGGASRDERGARAPREERTASGARAPREDRTASGARAPREERTASGARAPREERPRQGGASRDERGAHAPRQDRAASGARAPREERGREPTVPLPRLARGAPVATGDFVEGTLRMHREGYGFVHPTGGEQGNNVFIPAFDASRALDGDRVRVEVRGPEGRLEGRLVEVIGRRREQAVGIYMARGKRAWVEPQDARLGEVIQVPVTQIARPGDVVKVVLEVGGGLIDARQGLRGEVSGSLGRPGHPSAEVLSIVFAQGFNDEFPEEVMSEASACPSKVDARTARSGGRRDLRDLPLLTIDGADARDFDDAVYAAPHAKGYRLVVAIADVTHYVREDTALDAEALHRATSVYLPDRVLPMLPERLSNGICSLRPDEDRLCMVADLVLDRSGKRVSSELYPAVMRSVARCTYEEVQDVLDGKDVPHRNAFKPRFEQLNAVAGVLRAMRKKRGAIDFDLKETRIVVDDEGFPDHVELRERLGAHRLIEECMLAANEAVASTFRELELPTVYRFHGEPNEQKLGAFLELAAAHGFTITARDEVPSSVELNQLLEAVEGHAEQRVLNQLLLRSMMQAVYSSENVGHYGLAAENYLHFTSPIRRYPDLMVHRLLKEHWRRKGKARSLKLQDAEAARLEEISGHCSERERAAMQAEREVSQYYVCLMMQDRIGEVFEATVSSLTDFGFFAELTDVHVEGVVRSDALGPGVKLDLVHHVMTWPNGRKVRVGTPLTVRLVGINTQRRQLDLEVEAFTDDGPGAPSIEHGVGRATRGRSPTGASPDSRGAGGTRRPAPRGRGAAQEDAPSSRRSAQAKGTRAARPPEIAAPVAPPRAPGSDPGRPPRAEAKAPADAYGHRPAFVPPGMGEPLVPPRSEGSVHPGFDRLRALATQGRKDQTPERRSSGRGERGEGRKPGPGGRNRR